MNIKLTGIISTNIIYSTVACGWISSSTRRGRRIIVKSWSVIRIFHNASTSIVCSR